MALLTPEEVSVRLGLHKNAFPSFRLRSPDFPQPVRLTPRVFRWESEEVEEWINSKKDVPPDDDTPSEG